MPTLAEAEQFMRDQRSIEVRRLQWAKEKDERAERDVARMHARGQVEQTLNPQPEILPSIMSLTDHERRKYSIVNLIRDLAGRTGGAGAPEGMSLEREVSAAIAKDLGQVPAHGGCYVPLRLWASGLDSKSGATGRYLTSERYGGEIVDALRQHAQVLRLGARLMPNLSGNAMFPIEDINGVLAASWSTENPGADVAESDPAFQARVMQPHSLQGWTAVSRGLLQQSSAALEAWLRDRLARAHALSIDQASISGSATQGQPAGLINTSGPLVVSLGTDGAAPTASAILQLEANISRANADGDACAFLTHPVMRQQLRTIPEFSGANSALWHSDSTMLGYRGAASNAVPSALVKGGNSDCYGLFFGDWSTLFIGQFGALEIVVDQFGALKKRGMIEICSWGAYDTLFSQPGAFSLILDARNV